jgi:hypothetical protein
MKLSGFDPAMVADAHTFVFTLLDFATNDMIASY